MRYINVFNSKGKAVIIAALFESDDQPREVARFWQKACYEFNLIKPDYSVYQSKEAALEDARI